MTHTPAPWSWKGEDYRGGWGWQLLVGPNGEGILCGGGPDDKPYKHLRVGMAIEPKYCETGFNANADSAPCVHVQMADAHLIEAAPELLEACETALAVIEMDWEGDEPSITGNMLRAAIAKAKGGKQ